VTDREQYTPGPASGAQVRKDGEKWTLILIRELRHSPERVWQALTNPADLREWAPFNVDGSLGTVGTVNLTWVGTPTPLKTKVTRADAPKVLEYSDIRWELEDSGGGTRLTLWHSIDRRFISWGAAGWHISFDVLERFLTGKPLGRIVGADAMKFAGWQRLNAEYAKQFGVAPPTGRLRRLRSRESRGSQNNAPTTLYHECRTLDRASGVRAFFMDGQVRALVLSKRGSDENRPAPHLRACTLRRTG
jgi:uncharacterized protein YndB with AHSA1/START domain